MEGRHRPFRDVHEAGEMHALVMEMDYVELVQMPAHQREMRREVRQRVDDMSAAQRFRPGCDQPGRCHRVAAGEQRDILAGCDQRFG
jgi:hypothetical protein